MTSDFTGASPEHSTSATSATVAGQPEASTPALVTTDWLAAHLQDAGIRVADVRWYLPHIGKQGREEYSAGHIPGAVFVDLDTELAAHGRGGPGRHPIPGPAEFSSAMARAGVSADMHVVAYDDAGGGIAGRLWWLLRYYGHTRVSVLDGGITRWNAEGHALETKAPTVTPGRFEAKAQAGKTVDKVVVGQLARDPNAVVLDARAAERYEGKTEPVDPRPGHVPGALNAPFGGNVGPDQVFLSPDALRAKYEALGVTPDKAVVAYCGSGVTACNALLALHQAGFEHGLLYEGSWSDWSSDKSLPAATGPEPG